MHNINLHIFPCYDFTYESRIKRITKSMSYISKIDNIILVGIWNKGLSKFEKIDKKRSIIRIKLFTQILGSSIFSRMIQNFEWMIKIIFKFINKDIILINIHNLSVLPLAFVFKVFKKIKIIYDTHELETERNGWGILRKKISKIIELIFIKFIDYTLVVSPIIEKWYKEKYKIKAYTIINVPKLSKNHKSKIFHKIFNLSEDKIIFLYQGDFSKGRGLESLINIFKNNFFENKIIIFMGHGYYQKQIIELSRINNQIFYHPPVDPKILLRYTSSANVGLCLIENTCLSYYYSLPNKFFEYSMAKIPVIVSDLLLLKEITIKNKIGYVVKNNTLEESLIRLIQSIKKEDLKSFEENLIKFTKKYNWEIEEKKLLTLYNKLI